MSTYFFLQILDSIILKFWLQINYFILFNSYIVCMMREI